MKWLFSKIKALLVAMLTHPRLVVEFGVVCLIWLVWLAGPRMGLESVESRVQVIIVIGLLRFILYFLQHLLSQRRAEQLEASLQQQAQVQVAAARPDHKEELEALRRQFDKGVAALKQSNVGKGLKGKAALYALPWYMFIGPPASGKSTALRHSGLQFPRRDDPSAPARARGDRVPVQAVQRHRFTRCAQRRASDEVTMAMMGTVNIGSGPYTVGSPIARRLIEAVTMPVATSIVFVVDDDVSVRESLELLIRTAGWQPETFASAQEFLSRARSPVPCCLVLDVSLPGLNGLELQQQLAERTDMPIIFITGHADVPMSVRAMKAGAVEFLTKPFNDDVLLDAIRCAIERSRAALRHDSEMRVLQECYASLTPREREVMVLVVSGLLNKQVGGVLGISEITVKAHRVQVMRKMKADSLPGLVTMAARLGLQAAPTA